MFITMEDKKKDLFVILNLTVKQCASFFASLCDPFLSTN